MKIDLNNLIEKVRRLEQENKKLKQENELYVKESKEIEYNSNGDKTIKQYFEDKEIK